MYLGEKSKGRMKKLSSVVLTVFLMATATMGQEEETLFGESGLKLTGAWGGPVFGMTFFADEAAPTRGTFWGLEFNHVILAGFGNERTFESVPLKEGDNGSYDFKHKGFYLQFYPNKEKIIHPAFGFMLGGGELKDDFGKKDPLFVVQPTAGFEINVFKWWKVGVDGGYRFVSRTDLPDIEDKDLSSVFLNLKMRFGLSW